MNLTERSYKTGDVGSTFGATLSAFGDLDLTEATVRFIMRARDGDKIVTGTAAIDVEADHVLYTFTGDDLDTPGVYEAEWEVTFPGGSPPVVTFPDDGYHRIEILSDLD